VGKLEIAGARECGCRSANFVAEKLDGRETEESARFCDSRTTDVAGWVRERTAGRMADVVFECVGKNETVSQAIDLAAPGGRVMLVGNPTSDMLLEKQIYWKILRNQLTVRGTWNSSYDRSPEDDWHYVLKRLESGRIHPAELISHCFSLAELTQGFGIMRDKSEDYVKIMWG
jgi:L-iditol 2-dehydrogenase